MFLDTAFWLLVATGVLWGFMEQHVFRNGFRDMTYHLFGKISLRYHGTLWALWAIICYQAGYWWFTPAFAVIEDISYFAFHAEDTLDEYDWINFGLGGVRLFRWWIPFVYGIAGALTLLLAMFHYGIIKI